MRNTMLREKTAIVACCALMMLAVAGCRDYESEAQINAGAQVAIAESQSQAQRDVAYANAAAQANVANAQANASIAISGNQLEASKYESTQATTRAGIAAAVAPGMLAILAVTVLLGIVLWFRGQAHVIRTSNTYSQPQLTMQQRPAMPALRVPDQVAFKALQCDAHAVPGKAPGEWVLISNANNKPLLFLVPRQLTDSQHGGAA